MTPAQLIDCGIAPSLAAAFAEPLTAACDARGITTPLRLAAFIAQCSVESSRFGVLSEDLNYRTSARIFLVFGKRAGASEAECARLVGQPELLANTVYANRMGNGDAASGDGWRFRGAGLIQLTGRETQAKCAAVLGHDLETFGDWLRTPDGASQSAAWYWDAHGCNGRADRRDIDGCTRLINPAMEGAGLRRQVYADTSRAFAA